MKGCTKALAAGLLSLAVSAPAFAGCEGSDLKGRTFTMFIETDMPVKLANNDDTNWAENGHCTVKVKSNGDLKYNTGCYNAKNQQVGYVSGGNLSIKSNCKVKGYFVVASNSGEEIGRLSQARMSRDKNEVVGVGEDEGQWDFSITLVRH